MKGAKTGQQDSQDNDFGNWQKGVKGGNEVVGKERWGVGRLPILAVRCPVFLPAMKRTRQDNQDNAGQRRTTILLSRLPSLSFYTVLGMGV
jgi:hypothetical protein